MRFSSCWLTVVAISLLLPGCGWLFGDEGYFRDRSDDYRQARSTKALDVPPKMSEEAIDDSYMIPQITNEAALEGDFELPRPEPLSENIDEQTVTIQKLGDDRWILIEGTAGQVWPGVRGFLNMHQMPVARADAVSGIIETAWLQPAQEGLPQERYRVRIEQGVQRGTSELYILHDQAGSETEGWPDASANTERETVMVNEMAQYFADRAGTATVSMLAQRALDSQGKVFLKSDAEGDSYLSLKLPYFRAWASLGAALEKAGFEIKDWNQTAGKYWVEYRPPEGEEEQGWFASWFAGDDDEQKPGIPYLVRIIDQAADTEAVTITIEARGEQAQPLPKSESKRLLKRIKNFIS